MNDLAIMCDKIIEEKVPINLNEDKVSCKTQDFYILLAFLLIILASLIAVSIYCYLIQYRGKKYLLPFHFKNNKLREIIW